MPEIETQYDKNDFQKKYRTLSYSLPYVKKAQSDYYQRNKDKFRLKNQCYKEKLRLKEEANGTFNDKYLTSINKLFKLPKEKKQKKEK